MITCNFPFFIVWQRFCEPARLRAPAAPYTAKLHVRGGGVLVPLRIAHCPSILSTTSCSHIANFRLQNCTSLIQTPIWGRKLQMVLFWQRHCEQSARLNMSIGIPSQIAVDCKSVHFQWKNHNWLDFGKWCTIHKYIPVQNFGNFHHAVLKQMKMCKKIEGSCYQGAVSGTSIQLGNDSFSHSIT